MSKKLLIKFNRKDESTKRLIDKPELDDLDSGKVSRDTAEEGRNVIMEKGKDYAIEWIKLLKSKNRVIYAVEDDRFMDWVRKNFGPDEENHLRQQASIYKDEFSKLDNEQKRFMARQAIKYDLNKKVLSSIAQGMESPSREIFSALLEAFSDYATVSKELKDEMKYQLENEALDEINRFTDDEAHFMVTHVKPNLLKEIVGDETYSHITESAGNSTIGDGSDLIDIKTSGVDESVDDNSNKNLKLDPNKVPEKEKWKLIEDDKYYIYDDDGTYFKGPITEKEKEIISNNKKENLKKMGINEEDVHITLGSGYKNHLRKINIKRNSFSYRKPKINVSFTIVRAHNLFSKISEFIKERFPNNFSEIKGNRIYLNDGRYLKARITKIDSFSVTSYVNNIKQFSVELPLKVHKFKWQNDINDNIINK